jgi:hypothetical protein
VHARLTHVHRAEARGDRPLGQVAVADNLPMASLVCEVAMGIDPLGHLRFDRRREHLLGT